MLHEMTWLGEESAITRNTTASPRCCACSKPKPGPTAPETIRRKLALLRDIRSTIERTGGNCVFDDIELFELEVFRAAGGRASTTGFARASCGTSRAERGRRSASIRKANRLPHFFVYDALLGGAGDLRKQI